MRKLKNTELNRLNITQFKNIQKNPITIILDNIRSKNNVGSIFRTADAFICQKIYLCGITPPPPHREIQKTALGATESVNWTYSNKTIDAVNKCKAENYKIIAVEQIDTAIKLNKFNPKKNTKYALIFGHEINGIDQKIINSANTAIEIPQFGTKHSLNIAVAAAITIWHIIQKI